MPGPERTTEPARDGTPIRPPKVGAEKHTGSRLHTSGTGRVRRLTGPVACDDGNTSEKSFPRCDRCNCFIVLHMGKIVRPCVLPLVFGFPGAAGATAVFTSQLKGPQGAT